MRVFVTGATGVIGRRIVPRLIERGHAVTAVVRSTEQRTALVRTGVNAVAMDLFAPQSFPAALAAHDAVINLATHIPASSVRMFLPGAWRENDRIRREVSANLARDALRAGVTRFIQESFAPTYPSRGESWIDEGTPLEPARNNRSVVDAERSAEHFTHGGGTGVVLRFASFYGSDSRFLHELIGMIRHGFAPLLGPPENFISSVSHDDAANAVLTALELPSGTYNVSDDAPAHHREFVDALAEAIGAGSPRLPPVWLTPLAGSFGETFARSQRISNMKLRGHGWAPRYRSVHEGFAAVAREFGNLPAREHGEAARAGRSR